MNHNCCKLGLFAVPPDLTGGPSPGMGCSRKSCTRGWAGTVSKRARP